VSRDAGLRVRAFAKINVTLKVLGRRPDGYHDLRTVMQSIALHDRLSFDAASGPLVIECSNPDVPTDRTNLVWRAASLVWRAAGRSGPMRGVRVTIDKRIPLQAGLGGGSADAAATLRSLSRLWCPRLTPGQLTDIAARLGADVPFFLTGGTALGVDRGDRVFSLADARPAWVVLAKPDFGVGTPDAYRWFDEQPLDARWRTVREQFRGPYGEGGNDLQRPVVRRHPRIAALIRGLKQGGAFWAAMSGSGSACFGMFDNAEAARAAADGLTSPRCATWVTRTQSARQFARGSEPVQLALPR
jgi:4-diphosphocytidyl-2-C-methyl-D-erythritol kinase